MFLLSQLVFRIFERFTEYRDATAVSLFLSTAGSEGVFLLPLGSFGLWVFRGHLCRGKLPRRQRVSKKGKESDSAYH